MCNTSRNESRVRDLLLREQMLSDPDNGWKEFLAVHGPRIERILSRFGLSKEDNEEVFQEICRTLSKNRGMAIAKWDPRLCAFETYLTVIVVNHARNFLKSSFHLQSMRKVSPERWEDNWESLVDRIECPSRSIRERLEETELKAFFKETLDRLVKEEKIHPKDREILRLRLENVPYTKIAEFLGMESSSVRARLTRLKRILRQALLSVEIDLDL